MRAGLKVALFIAKLCEKLCERVESLMICPPVMYLNGPEVFAWPWTMYMYIALHAFVLTVTSLQLLYGFKALGQVEPLQSSLQQSLLLILPVLQHQVGNVTPYATKISFGFGAHSWALAVRRLRFTSTSRLRHSLLVS